MIKFRVEIYKRANISFCRAARVLGVGGEENAAEIVCGCHCFKICSIAM